MADITVIVVASEVLCLEKAFFKFLDRHIPDLLLVQGGDGFVPGLNVQVPGFLDKKDAGNGFAVEAARGLIVAARPLAAPQEVGDVNLLADFKELSSRDRLAVH